MRDSQGNHSSDSSGGECSTGMYTGRYPARWKIRAGGGDPRAAAIRQRAHSSRSTAGRRRKHNRNATETQQYTNRRTRNNSINQLITQVHTAALINGGEFSRSHIRRDLCSMTIKRRRTARAGAENRSITGRISATVRGQGESSRADLWQCCTAGHSEERQRQRKQRRQRIAYTGRTVPEKSSENTGQGRRRS